jgi:hypothetical protein
LRSTHSATEQMEARSIYQEILEKIRRLRRKENKERFLTASLFFFLTLLGILLAALGLEAIFHLGVGGRTFLFWIVVFVLALDLTGFVVLPLARLLGFLKSSSDEVMAKKAGGHFPHIKDRVLNLLQLHREKEEGRTLYSVGLIDAAFEDLRSDIAALDFSEAITYTRPKKIGTAALFAGCGAALLFLVFRAPISDAAHRLTHFREEFVVPPAVRFTVQPGNAEVVRGEDVELNIAVEGSPLGNISLLTRQEGEINFARISLKKNREGNFSYEVAGIKQSMDYYAEASGVESEKYTIKVIDRPLVKNLRLRLTYPSYTNIPTKDLDDNVGDVTALLGTTIDVDVRSNKEAARASIIFNDGTEVPMKIAGLSASTRLALSKDRSYHIRLADEKGVENSNPIEYQLKAVRDEDPTVNIVSPGRDMDLTDDRRLPLLLRLHDDFGFTRLRLGYKLVHSRYEQPAEEYSFLNVPFEKLRSTSSAAAADIDVPYLWELKSLNLATEDVVSYFAEVYDNDAVSGPKVGRSQTYTIRVPSLDEIFADVEKSHNETAGELKESAETAKELRKQLDEVNQDLKKSRDQLNWEKQKKSEELLKKYDQLQKNIQETNRKLDEVIQQMEKNRLVSPETIEKYLELQKLIEQINSPELQEAMKKLQEALRNLDPEQMREALQKFTFSEEQFRQSLERTLSLLKRIQIEQKLQEALKRTAELLQKQQELKSQTQQTSPSDREKRQELSRKQNDARKDLDALDKALSELEKRMQEFPEEMPLEELNQAREDLAKQQVGQKMEQSSQELQSGEMQSAETKQQEVASSLEQLLKQLQQTQQAMYQKQQQQITRDLKKMMQNLLELSKEQESLKNESKELEPNSQQFREKAQEQMGVANELSNLIESMMKMSQRTFAVTREMGKSMGKALSEMNEAMNGIESRNGLAAAQHQGLAMGALNEAAAEVMNSLQMMMQGGSGGLQSLLMQLQRMAGQQQGINTGTMNLGEMGSMTSEQQAEMSRLAAEQAAVQKSLEQLSEEARQSAERERILGDLGKIGEDMKEVVRDLEQRNVNPNTIKRQERILSRLLDASRSMRERDFEKRRKAEPGKDVVRKGPQELDLATQEGKNRLMQDLLKAMEEGYAKDYEELIRKYFEALQKQQVSKQ